MLQVFELQNVLIMLVERHLRTYLHKVTFASMSRILEPHQSEIIFRILRSVGKYIETCIVEQAIQKKFLSKSALKLPSCPEHSRCKLYGDTGC